MKDLLLRLRIDPDSFPYLAFDSGHLLHEAVDVFSLPPGIGTDIDHVHVLPFQKAADDLKLLFHRRNHLIEEFFRDKRQGRKTPAPVFLVVDLRITHAHQMTDAPGHHGILTLQIAVFTDAVYMESPGKFLGHAGFLRNI